MDKNKQFLIEAIAGLVVLIALIAFAIWLLVRGGTNKSHDEDENIPRIEEEAGQEQAVTEPELPGTEKNGATEVEGTAQGIDLNEVNRKKTASKDELPQTYTPGSALEWTGDNYQMPELFNCWNNYELDAVTDIVKLERFRKITLSLSDSNDFYYYGEKNGAGKPEGKGLAVYAHDTYYFGEFKNGLREGEGMWVRLFPDVPGTVNGIEGVTWHQYSGKWAGDYPNGEGQENIQYEAESDIGFDKYAIQNAIGGFADGFYNGEMYIMTRSGDSTTDWYGKAKRGIFEYIGDKKGYKDKRAIWQAGDGYETGEEDNMRWILPADNADYGIAGLKKA